MSEPHQAVKAVVGCCVSAGAWIWHYVDAGTRFFERIGPLIDGIGGVLGVVAAALTIRMLLKGRRNGRQR